MESFRDLVQLPRTRPGLNLIVLFCALLIGIRILFINAMGIMPQDAYYDFYAQHLDLSYYDHPPLIAYTLRLFTTLLGKKVVVLKLADSFITMLTIISFYKLSGKFLSRNKAQLATALFISTLMVSILSLVSTPDVPLMLCWTISLNFLYEAIWKKRNIYWVWSGVFTGLSFDSKYTALFLIIGLIGFLLISKSYRNLIASKWFFLFLISFLITILPVVIWNAKNNFASFKFQSEGRVKEGLHIDITGFFGVIGHQSAVLLPLLFFSFVYLFYRYIKKYGIMAGRIPSDQFFLLCFFIPLFLGFFFISFFYWVKLNWMMPAYITGIIWVSRYWKIKWIRLQLIFSLFLHLLLAIEIIFYIVPIRSDDTWFGWTTFSDSVTTIRERYPQAFIFSTDDYKTAAILNFYLNETVYSKNIVGEKALQFDFVGTDLRKLNGRNAIYIDSNPHFSDMKNENEAIPLSYYSYFDQIIPLEPILINKNGKAVRKFSTFLCTNYHFK